MASIAVSAALGAGASLIGSLNSASAAKSAAQTQSDAALQAANLTHQQYLQTRSDLAPYNATGQAALSQLANIYGLPQSQFSSGGPQSVGQQPSPSGVVQTPQGNVATSFGALDQPQGQPLPPGAQLQWSLGQSFDPSGNGGGGLSNGYWTAVDQNGNVLGTFDQSGGVQSGPYAYPGQPGQTGAGGSAGSAGQPGASGQAPGSALAQYGLPGVTYNPSLYGLGNGTYDPSQYGLGNGVFDPSQYGLGNGTFNPTQATLEQTPGYQFAYDQGLKAVQNSATSRGQGVSGAAQKAAAQYAQGLASQTYGQQAQIFNQNLQNAQGVYSGNLANTRGIYSGNLANTQGIFQQNLSNVINPLFQYAQLGQNAAAQTGSIGAGLINSQSNLLTGAANAQAAGTVGSANALNSGLSGVGASAQQALLLNNLLQSQTAINPAATAGYGNVGPWQSAGAYGSLNNQGIY